VLQSTEFRDKSARKQRKSNKERAAEPIKTKRKATPPPTKAQARALYAQAAAGGRSDDSVLTFSEWCGCNSFSVPTGRRIKASGLGPQFIRLGVHLLGVTVGENRRWQQSRQIG
jgi:hypothetical protein